MLKERCRKRKFERKKKQKKSKKTVYEILFGPKGATVKEIQLK